MAVARRSGEPARGRPVRRAAQSRAGRTRWDLAEANLAGLEARQALFLKVSAPRARAAGVDFSGLQWLKGSLVGANLQGARLAGCQWLGVDLAGANLPEACWQNAAAVEGTRRHPSPFSTTNRSPRWNPWSFQRDQLLRVESRRTAPPVRLRRRHPQNLGRRLRARPPYPLRPFKISHGMYVEPKVQRLLSASDDSTLKIWDAASGHCLLTLSGHLKSVTACTWSPEGQRLPVRFRGRYPQGLGRRVRELPPLPSPAIQNQSQRAHGARTDSASCLPPTTTPSKSGMPPRDSV